MYSQKLNSCNFDIKRCYLELVYSVLLNGNLLNHLDKVSSYGVQNILYGGYRFGIRMILSFATLFTVGLAKTNERIWEINSTHEYFKQYFDNCDYGNYKQYYDIAKTVFNNDKFAEFSEMYRNDKYNNVFETYKNMVLNCENENEKIDEFTKLSALCLTDMTTFATNEVYNKIFDTNCKINQSLMETINSIYVNCSNKYFEDADKLNEENFNDNYEEQINKSGFKHIIPLCKVYYNNAFCDANVKMGFERNINVNTYSNDIDDELDV